ncbi:MAG: glycosyltransferase [Planctomycetota bacterium]|nr:glycosyltransferase [Planctomycetota bacterium]MDA1213195.1 glycosyltransferase [Planctomycetota bacterium]
MAWLIEYGGWILLAVWVVTLGPGWLTFRKRLLHRITAPPDSNFDWPLVSIVVPARDEAGQIETTLRSLLALNYPRFEIIAINDRSQDDTGVLMDNVAKDDTRIRVVHVRELPSGWLGKNHALALGARQAAGEFILFTDGDIVFQPDILTSTMAVMLEKSYDHLCLIPQLIPGRYLENSLVTQFTLLFSAGVQPWLVSSPIKRFYAGIGAFNLVKKSSYEQCGGHETIRMDILDDVKLGKLFKQNGFRQELLVPGDGIAVRWQTSAWGVIRGLEKNAFASVNYSLVTLLLFTVAILIIEIFPYVGMVVVDGPARWGYIATLLFAHTYYAWAGQMAHADWRTFPMLPISLLGMLFAYWRSAFIALKNGGVRWRDTFYPLDVLRKNLY